MRSLFEKWKNDPDYTRGLLQETLILNVTEDLLLEMRTRGIERAQLAERLDKSKGHVSQLFSGERNMTLRTIANICWALDLEPTFKFEPAQTSVVAEQTTTLTFQLKQEKPSEARFTLLDGGLHFGSNRPAA